MLVRGGRHGPPCCRPRLAARCGIVMVGADIGALNVLCYDHELSPLERRLRDALDEPLKVQGRSGAFSRLPSVYR